MQHLKLISMLAALLLSSTLMSQISDSLDLVLKRADEAGLIQEKDFGTLAFPDTKAELLNPFS